MVKRITSFFFFFFLFIFRVYAIPVNINSDKYIIYNLDDNRILEENKSHDEVQVASLTKIMTALLAIENVDDLNKKVTITQDMIDGITRDISAVGFKVGEKYTYYDLLYATMLPSAADAANAIAISIGGSIPGFVKMMNAKAKELGLTNTHYNNAFGLTDEQNYSSAYDVSKLLIYALKNDTFKTIYSAKDYKLSNGLKVKSTVYKYGDNYILGSKTGFTTAAGRCISSISNVNGTNLLVVTLHHSDKGLIYITETVNIYKYYEANYSYKNIIDENDLVTTIEVKNAKVSDYDIKVDKEYTYYLDNSFSKDDLIYEYDGIKTIRKSLKKDSKIGTVKVILNNEVIKEIDVLYDGSIVFNDYKILFYSIYIGLVVILIIVLIIRWIKRI